MSSSIVSNRPWGVLILLTIFTMSHFINYLKDTIAELKHVSWPTQKQSLVYTALVVGISIIVSLFVGFVDFGFSRGLNWFIS
jgi:preprotein translocase subunit SecE